MVECSKITRHTTAPSKAACILAARGHAKTKHDQFQVQFTHTSSPALANRRTLDDGRHRHHRLVLLIRHAHRLGRRLLQVGPNFDGWKFTKSVKKLSSLVARGCNFRLSSTTLRSSSRITFSPTHEIAPIYSFASQILLVDEILAINSLSYRNFTFWSTVTSLIENRQQKFAALRKRRTHETQYGGGYLQREITSQNYCSPKIEKIWVDFGKLEKTLHHVRVQKFTRHNTRISRVNKRTNKKPPGLVR